MNSGAASNFEWRHLAEYQATGYLTAAADCGDIHVAPDASRIGNPARDVMVMPLSMENHPYGFQLPPQDISPLGGDLFLMY